MSEAWEEPVEARYTSRMPSSLLERVRVFARRDRRSLSDAIRVLVERALNAAAASPPSTDPVDRVP